jgi:predicted permease
MPTGDLVPLLLGLFAILAVGVLLRATERLGQADANVLNRVVLDVTMPALVVSVLQRSGLGVGSESALIATSAALFASALAGVAVARALGLPRATQGAGGLCAGFCNTGFLGIPIVLAIYGDRAGAVGTAILIDTFATTLLLWTFGVGLARRLGSGERVDPRALLGLLAQPATIAVAVGLALRALPIALPRWASQALETLGSATPALVFLSLGLSLDARGLRGRAAPLAAVAAIKLVVSPAVALGVVLLLGLRGPAAEVAVLQAAMPSAMVSVIIAARYGCDAPFAAAAALVTTLGTLGTLPLVLELLRRLGV